VQQPMRKILVLIKDQEERTLRRKYQTKEGQEERMLRRRIKVIMIVERGGRGTLRCVHDGGDGQRLPMMLGSGTEVPGAVSLRCCRDDG
jgi:hypothetical protein